MLRITRPELTDTSLKYLHKLTQVIVSASDQKITARSRWESKSPKEFAFIKDALRSMCSGIERCMYCEDSKGTDIEHFRPKSDYPHLAFTWSNYLLACSHCNSNEKRDEFPLDADQQAMIIDPCTDNPNDHLALLPTGEYACRTPKGFESVRVFGLNRSDLVEARRISWSGFAALAKSTWEAHQAGRRSEAEFLAAAYRLPHGSVLATMIQYAEMGTPIMEDELAQALCYIASKG